MPFEGWEVDVRVTNQMEWGISISILELECCGCRVHKPFKPALFCDKVCLSVIYHMDCLAKHVIYNTLLALFSNNLCLGLGKSLFIDLIHVFNVLNHFAVLLFTLSNTSPLVVIDRLSLFFRQIAVIHLLKRSFAPGIKIIPEVGLHENLICVTSMLGLR